LLRTQGLTISRALNGGEDEASSNRQVTEISALFIRTYNVQPLANVEPLYMSMTKVRRSNLIQITTYEEVRKIIEEDLKQEKHE
jgi:hypothetical protein